MVGWDVANRHGQSSLTAPQHPRPQGRRGPALVTWVPVGLQEPASARPTLYLSASLFQSLSAIRAPARNILAQATLGKVSHKTSDKREKRQSSFVTFK